MEMTDNKSVSLGEFFDTIFRENTGYLYVATKDPKNDNSFSQKFFEWPTEKNLALAFISKESSKVEVYYAPALFKSASSLKKEVSGANVVWCEFDGNVPDSLNGIPEPSIKVISSSDSHQHWYWTLSEFIYPIDLEKINKRLTYSLGADVSGWDANQILRPIGTINHKRAKAVRLHELNENVYTASSFETLPEAPTGVEVPVPTSIPDVNQVIATNKLPQRIWDLFTTGKPEGHRSEALMDLAYSVAELGLTNEEVFALLLNADNRWGKYSKRSDQLKRLGEIVSRARAKYPLIGTTDPDNLLATSYNLTEFMETEVNIEWVWEGMLQQGGLMLLSGAPGLGKTQLSLQAGYTLALGGTLFGRNVNPVGRVGVFSLEMGHSDLKAFMQLQMNYYTDEEVSTLGKKLQVFPLGESLYLDNPEVAKQFEAIVREHELDGVVIDSLGSCVSGSLSDDTHMRAFMSWCDSFRARTGKFMWFIHHNRKANSDNKKPKKLDDIFGSQYITGRATSVVTLYGDPTVNKNKLEFIPLKIRMGALPNAMNIYRTEYLLFTDKNVGLTSEHTQVKMPQKELSKNMKGFSPYANPK